MSERRCASCQQPVGADDRFCTACGRVLASSRPAPGDAVERIDQVDQADQVDGPGARLVECEACGASNAASRLLCARCATPLREEVPGGDALPGPLPPAPADAPSGGRDTSPVLLSLVLLAGLITAGVLLALVFSRATTGQQPGRIEGARLVGALASSAVDGHRALEAIDGSAATSWHEAAAGPGAGEWLEVELAATSVVRGVLLRNGDQADEDAFEAHGRAAAVRIEVGDRQFRVELLDIRVPQSIPLPVEDGVVADRVRLVVEDTFDDTGVLAISEVVIEADPVE